MTIQELIHDIAEYQRASARVDGVLTILARPIYDEDTGWLYWERL